MNFKLNDTILSLDVPFKTSGGTQYPANWLRFSTLEEKTALGITEINEDDVSVYDTRFYNKDGTPKVLADVKTLLKNSEELNTYEYLKKYDWYVIRKAEKSTAIPTYIATFRDGVRAACTAREAEIDACADIAALETLYQNKEDGSPNMTQYPADPYPN